MEVLYDRPYMRKSLTPNFRCVTDYLIFTLIAFFLLQTFFKIFDGDRRLLEFLGTSFNGLKSGFVWTFFTYSLLHEGVLHLLFNLLGIHFIARNVEYILSTKKYFELFFVSTFTGSFLWVIFNSDFGLLLGASAFVMACLTYFCLKKPNDPITFLLFFILPVKLKPKFLLMGVLGLELYGFIFGELQNSSSIAHSAHLGGMVVGLLYSYSRFNLPRFPKFSFKFRGTQGTVNKSFRDESKYTINKETDREVEIQIDKILDKINENGFGSLNDDEKRLLEKAQTLFNDKRK